MLDESLAGRAKNWRDYVIMTGVGKQFYEGVYACRFAAPFLSYMTPVDREHLPLQDWIRKVVRILARVSEANGNLCVTYNAFNLEQGFSAER